MKVRIIDKCSIERNKGTKEEARKGRTKQGMIEFI